MKFNLYPEITSVAQDDTALFYQQSSGEVKQVKKSSLGLIPSVATIAALKALSVSGLATGTVVNLLGYYASSDGGDGLFYYSAASAAADNGGTVIQPDVGSGRWLRIYDSEIHTRWFGAKGDDTQDDTAFLQAATTASDSRTLILDTGNYKVTGTIDVPRSIKITGPTRRSVGAAPTAKGAAIKAYFAGPVWRFTSGGSVALDLIIEHHQVIGDGSAYGAGNGIEITNGHDFTIQDMIVAGFKTNQIKIGSGSNSSLLRNVYVAASGESPTGANIELNSEFCTLENVSSDDSPYAISLLSGAFGTRISGGVLEGALTAQLLIASGAIDCEVTGVRFNMTAGGKGIESNANRTRIVSNKFFGVAATFGIDYTGFQNTITGNFMSGVNVGIRGIGSGLDTITCNPITAVVTGLQVNFSTYYSVVDGNFLAGGTNSVVHTNGKCLYGTNRYDDGAGNFLAPTITAGGATAHFSMIFMGNSYNAVAPAATGYCNVFDPIANSTFRVLVANP